MFGRVKKWLGIEGAKMELLLADSYRLKHKMIDGMIIFYAMNDERIESVHIQLIEKYHRGRRKNKLVNEIVLGEMTVDAPFDVPQDEEVELKFKLEYEPSMSPMDQLGSSNFMMKGIVGAAKKLKGVKSHYFVIAEAKVKGTKFSPFVKNEVFID